MISIGFSFYLRGSREGGGRADGGDEDGGRELHVDCFLDYPKECEAEGVASSKFWMSCVCVTRMRVPRRKATACLCRERFEKDLRSETSTGVST